MFAAVRMLELNPSYKQLQVLLRAQIFETQEVPENWRKLFDTQVDVAISQGPTTAVKSKRKHFPPKGLLSECKPAGPLISDLWLKILKEKTSVTLSHPVWGATGPSSL